jgi:MFS family permease
MDRSMWAVLGGTFTLRFSTGLTGAMLAVYLAKLPEHGGEVVHASTLALLASAFFVSELLLSPVFGVISDRLGHHRMMLVGPAFGATAVILTGLTTSLPLLGGTRILEGASTAASVPSILGYIAVATAGSEVLRGKAAARFEGATLAGIGAGFAVAPLLFAALGPTAFFLNAVVYGVSFLIYRFGVEDRDAAERAAAHAGESGQGRRIDWTRYGRVLRSSHVWLLAPTWIAVNASIGLWFSQSLFQFSRIDPRFPEQALHRGFHPMQISLAAVVVGVVFGAGLLYWGNRFRNMRRTTIILYGIGGGAVLAVGGVVVNHGAGMAVVVSVAGLLAMAFGLFVLAGATPAALGLLADMSERFPSDRGAIMGLYSVFLALGQIVGSQIGVVAADRYGIDGLLIATFALLALALGPLALLRRQEHQLGPDDSERGPATMAEEPGS